MKPALDLRNRLSALLLFPLLFLLALVSASAPRTGEASALGGQVEIAGAPKAGTLIAVGGGTLPPSVIERFVERAGGREGRIVVIPTASESYKDEDAGRIVARWRGRGAGSVEVLHCARRSDANERAARALIDDATGVWIAGGKQKILSERFCGTAVEDALFGLLERGGVIGGTSAGTAILSKVMIEDGKRLPVEGVGFGLMPGVIFDQHFSERRREERLQAMLKKHSTLTGIGIDECTAAVIDLRSRSLDVLGSGAVWLYRDGAIPQRLTEQSVSLVIGARRD